MEYNLVKEAINETVEQIATSDSWNQEPIVIIDYRDWSVQKFENDVEARGYLERYLDLDNWSDKGLPWNGEDDEEIILIKYCGGFAKRKNPYKYDDSYKFYKEINGVKIYRKKELATFSANVFMSVNI